MKNKKQIVGFTAGNFDLIHPVTFIPSNQQNIVINLLYF